MIQDLQIDKNLSPLLELTARVGCNPLLTQASTGNISMKIDESLWIKASGRWMSNAAREKILISLDLEAVRKCIGQKLDPADRYPNASIETAMHVTLPHPVVLHVHSLNTIAWAVRADAPAELKTRLEGLRWHWIPYVPSGLPLASEIEKVLAQHPATDLLVLGNHGLVLGGADCQATEKLLLEVERRLAIAPRHAHPADYALLAELAEDPLWDVPEDDAIHALATDPVARTILAGGFLYPCQAIFSDATTPDLFTSAPDPVPSTAGQWRARYDARPFVMIEGRGVVVRRDLSPAERAMLSGLAQVVQRIGPSAPLRYLTETEVAASSSTAAYRYRELANAHH